MEEAKRIYGERNDFTLCEHQNDVLEGADALVILTEWRIFRSPDFELIKNKLNNAVIFDGRNIYDPEFLASQGIDYFGMGRGKSCEQ